MKTMNFIKTLGGVAVFAACAAANSEANLLTPNTSTFPNSVSQEVLGGINLTQLGSTLVSSYANLGQVGTLTSEVWENNANNTLGGLTFVYQVADGGLNAADVVATLALNDFTSAGTQVDVAYESGTGVAPTIVNWSATGTPINFEFDNNIPVGGDSAYLIVNTSVQNYEINTANVINSQTAVAADYSPVPEPTTVIAGLLLLLPLGISGYRIVRNRNVAQI